MPRPERIRVDLQGDNLKLAVDGSDMVQDLQQLREGLDAVEGNLITTTDKLHAIELWADTVNRDLADLRGRVRNDQLVVGSGDPAKDEVAIDAALAQLKVKPGVLYLEGTVYFPNKYLEFPAGMVGLEGLNNARVICRKVGGVQCGWQANYTPQWQFDCTAPAFGEEIKITGSSAGVPLPQPGDWVLVKSEDVIPDVLPHYGDGGSQCPMELHQVDHVKGSDTLVLTDCVIDPIQASGKLAIVPMLSGRFIRNLRAVSAPDVVQGDYQVFCMFNATEGAVIEGVTLERNGPGAVSFQFSADFLMTRCNIYGTARADIVYGVTVGVVNRGLVRECNLIGTRHAFTTTGGAGNAALKRRWGTALNTAIEDCFVSAATKTDGNSRIALDTHSEGWGIRFSRNVIVISGTAGNVGIQTRSRATVIEGNLVLAGRSKVISSNAKSIRSYGADTIIKDNMIQNGWLAIQLYDGAKRAVIQGNMAVNVSGPLVYQATPSDGHQIRDNVVTNCGQLQTGTPAISKSAIVLPFGTGHEITGNQLRKFSNVSSMDLGDRTPADVWVAGNYTRGYGANKVGFGGPGEAAMEAAYSGRNVTDT